jgi:large subunit ribosomal protein L17e
LGFRRQVRYAANPSNEAKSAKSRGSFLRVSFKNTREAAQAVSGMKLTRALTFLENVKEHKEAVPMRRYAGGTGRTAQGTFARVYGGMELKGATENAAGHCGYDV